MKADDLEELEAGEKLRLREQYLAALGAYRYQVEVDSNIYLANKVDVEVFQAGDAAYFEITLTDAWSWTMYRPVRTLAKVRLLSLFDTVVIEDMKQP